MPEASAAVEVHRAALRRRAGAEVLRALHVDQLGALFQVALVEQGFGRHILHVVDVGDVARARRRRRASSPRSAGAGCPAPSTGMRAQVEVLEHAERHQRDDALAVGRDLVQRVAAVVHLAAASTQSDLCAARSDARIAPPCFLRVRLRSSRRARRGRTPRPWSRRSSPSTSACAGNAKALAGAAARVRPGMKASAKPGCAFSSGDLLVPLPRDGRRDEEAVARRSSMARSKSFSNGSLPNLPCSSTQAETQPGTRDRVPAAHRHRLLAGEVVERPAGRRAAGGVQAVQLLAVPDDRVRVRADAVRHRLDQRQRDRGGEDRVDRVAACGEHLQARLRGERLRRGDDVLARAAACAARRKGSSRRKALPFKRACSKSSTTRPEHAARLQVFAGPRSPGRRDASRSAMGLSFFFFASATTSFSSCRLPT